MSARLGQTISCSMLHDFTATSKRGARFPVWFILPFCEAVGSDALQRKLMGSRLLRLVEFAEAELSALEDAEYREHLRRELRKGKHA